MDNLLCEVRFEADESRMSPGRLTGTLLTYGERASDRAERFADGALHWPESGIVINSMHNRQAPILRAVPFLEGRAVKIDAALPNTTAGRDAAENVRQGILTGLSVEFNAEQESRVGGVREIRRARLGGAGLVDTASYAGSGVEVRAADTARRKRYAWLLL